MDFDRKTMCEAVNEACRKLGMPGLDEKVVRLIVEVANDCFELGYKAGRAAAEETNGSRFHS